MTTGNSIVDAKKRDSFFWCLYTIAYLSLALLPAIKYSVPYLLAAGFCLLPIIFVSLTDTRYCKILFVLAICGAIQGLVSFLNANASVEEIINEPIRCIRYFIPCLLFEKIVNGERLYQRVVWIFTTALLLFVVYKTLVAIEQNPMVARILAQGTLEENDITEFRMGNVGGFGNCYAICLTFSIWAYLFFKSRKLIAKIIYAVVLIFIFYFTLQVQYMTMLLLCILALLIVILYVPKNAAIKLIAVGVCIAIFGFAPAILRWVASLDVGTQIYTKIMNIVNMLEGTMEFSDTTSRSGLYKDAFLEFLYSPIWGGYNSIAAKVSHSTILGIAASSGLIGISAYIYGIYKCYKESVFNLNVNGIDTSAFILGYTIFIVLAIVNPLHYIYEISTVMFLYIPLTLLLFGGKKSEK